MLYCIIPVSSIRVARKQKGKCSKDKVRSHTQSLKDGIDTFPIDVHILMDGTYTIAGNGRHRYFAYLESGYEHVPVCVLNT